MSAARRFRGTNYRGYSLWVMTNGTVQICALGDPDVVCTEADMSKAQAVIDEWVSAR